MDRFFDLDFSQLEDIPAHLSRYTTPQTTVSEKGMVSLNSVMLKPWAASGCFGPGSAPTATGWCCTGRESPTCGFPPKAGTLPALSWRSCCGRRGSPCRRRTPWSGARNKRPGWAAARRYPLPLRCLCWTPPASPRGKREGGEAREDQVQAPLPLGAAPD